MAQLKFYRGLKANYVAETTHKDGFTLLQTPMKSL